MHQYVFRRTSCNILPQNDADLPQHSSPAFVIPDIQAPFMKKLKYKPLNQRLCKEELLCKEKPGELRSLLSGAGWVAALLLGDPAHPFGKGCSGARGVGLRPHGPLPGCAGPRNPGPAVSGDKILCRLCRASRSWAGCAGSQNAVPAVPDFVILGRLCRASRPFAGCTGPRDPGPAQTVPGVETLYRLSRA
jgi:hypothetical protein